MIRVVLVHAKEGDKHEIKFNIRYEYASSSGEDSLPPPLPRRRMEATMVADFGSSEETEPLKNPRPLKLCSRS